MPKTTWTISNDTPDLNEAGTRWGGRSVPCQGGRTLIIEYNGNPPAGALQASADEAIDAVVEAAQKALEKDAAVGRYLRATRQFDAANAERARMHSRVKELEGERDTIRAELPDGAADRLQALEVELGDTRAKLEAAGRVVATLSPIVIASRTPAERACKEACKAPRLDEAKRLQSLRGAVLAKLAKAAGSLLDDFARLEAACESLRTLATVYGRTVAQVIGQPRPDVPLLERAG